MHEKLHLTVLFSIIPLYQPSCLIVQLVMVCVFNRKTLSSCPRDSLEISSVDDVYKLLWDNNSHIASETLNVDFLQKMKTGSLEAERYIKFTMQDINYILKVTGMLKSMSEKEIQHDDLKKFIIDRYQSYTECATLMLKEFSFGVRTKNNDFKVSKGF